MIDKTLYYTIADLQLELTLPKECDESVILPNFSPFVTHKSLEFHTSCHIYISFVDLEFELQSANLLSDISIVWGDRFTFYETDEYYWTLIQYSPDKNRHWKMRSSKDFTTNTIYCGHFDNVKNNFISWYCMVGFAQSSLIHKCVLIHASVVVDDNYGYAFLGKSGTGKSTHSRLWIEHNNGFKLLNDDNPAIRIVNGEVFVYGSPWSGKTQCYISDMRPLKGFVRLKQAPYNRFERRKNKEALLSLLPSCSAIRWNLTLYSTLVNTLIELISTVRVGELECLPDGHAAKLCYEELKRN